MIDLNPYKQALSEVSLIPVRGKVIEVIGNRITAFNPGMKIGSLCDIISDDNRQTRLGQAVGFRGKNVYIMPFDETHGISPNDYIVPRNETAITQVDISLLGRVMDSMGNPIDGLGAFVAGKEQPLYPNILNPLKRRRISEVMDVGIKAINGLLTVGKGQRIGIFSGSGIGKSVLLGMMARSTKADVNVIALIGERGREVKEFLDKDLGEEGQAKSVVVVATSDQSALSRLRGAFLATSIAEYFRDLGKDVLLMMDSITRFAMAQREIGLSVGEPPTTKGYPPSVFSLLPKLLERTGTHSGEGSITGFYTVLVEGDDMNDPIGDSVRSIIDGHIVLSREIAAANHFPAIDVLNSKSRVMNDITSQNNQKLSRYLNATLATYREAADLINIGAYVAGTNADIDYAIKKMDTINQFLRQNIEESFGYEECLAIMEQIFIDYPEENK